MHSPGDTGRKTMQFLPIDPATAAAHRRALELEAMPKLAQAVCDEGVNPEQAGERVRAAIDALLGERGKPGALPEASPATKGQCNDERACGACFSGQGQCEHASDCAQHNEPAMPAGPCDCGAGDGYNATSRPNRVRIEGDGTSARTCITNATTGERIPFVKSYRVEQRAGEPAKAVIEVLLPQVSLECDADVVAVAPPSIQLTPAEVQSGVDRVRWAELLIKQLPADHDGRNSWLLNFGSAAPDLRPTASDDDF